MGKQGLLTAAVAVLAVVVAAGLLRFALEPAPVVASSTEGEQAGDDAVEASEEVEQAPPMETALLGSAEPQGEAGAGPEPSIESGAEAEAAAAAPAPIVADVDALVLIDAYERRNALLSARLRDAVQARLLVAVARTEEALRIAAQEPARASSLQALAMEELQQVRKRDLRSISQELHPSLLRLGLPVALRALARDFEDELAVRLDVDAECDSVAGQWGRPRVDTRVRLVVYRLARETLGALGSSAEDCVLRLARTGDDLTLAIEAETADFDDGALEAAAIAVEAHGGSLSVERAQRHDAGGDRRLAVTATMPAPNAGELSEEELRLIQAYADDSGSAAWEVAGHEPTADKAADDTDAGPAPAPPIRIVMTLPGDSEFLGPSLQALAARVAERIELVLDVDPTVDAVDLHGEPTMDRAVQGELYRVVCDAVDALADEGATRCEATVRRHDNDVSATIAAETEGESLELLRLDTVREAVQARGGFVSVTRSDRTLTVTAEVPGESADLPLVIRVERVGADGSVDGDASGEDAA